MKDHTSFLSFLLPGGIVFMENGSSTGSYISLTESEPYESTLGNTVQYKSSQQSGNNSYTHKYNTRLSARRFSAVIGTPLKKLYVDLSNSRVDIPTNYLQVVANTWEGIKERRESTSSQDSREFDFGSRDIPKRIELREENMFEINPCMPRNNWLKYFIVLSLTAVFYVYIQLLHNSELVKKLHNDLLRLKLDVEGSRYTLSQVEGMTLQLKRDHEKMEKNLHKIISKEIEKFSSDKTGKTDFALESTGGKIIQLSPGTENFEQAVSVLGVQLCDGKHGPRAMIQADMSPGHCWAIKGSTGGVVIKLLGNVKVDSISMEHISKSLSPTGDVSSAPKNFSIWGLRSPKERGTLLGEFMYNVGGSLVQTYSVTASNYFEFVEFRVLSNQGNPDFTCIYRLRVHGILEKMGGR